MSLLSVDEARARILAGANPVTSESVDLLSAPGRVLVDPVAALRTQPPFDVSAMDGYAVRRDDIAEPPASLTVIGESAAGRGFRGAVSAGQAVRIFTGAPIPQGADAIVIQEDTERSGDTVTVHDGAPDAAHFRKRGIDFSEGDALLAGGCRLTPRDVTLAAAMGHGTLTVRRKPTVGIVATGDELVLPGQPVGDDQIVCSNPFGIAGMIERGGGAPEFLGIARDDRDDLAEHFKRAQGMDILVTIGGASVGDHDLVAPVLADLGMSMDFWRIAMRPGKPLMFGRLGNTFVIGLPGNPVSSLICTRIFVLPLVSALLGQSHAADPLLSAQAAVAMTANGPRQHYMRAISHTDRDGRWCVTPIRSQDSSLLAPLANSDVLIVRPPHDPAIAQGDTVQVLRMDF